MHPDFLDTPAIDMLPIQHAHDTFQPALPNDVLPFRPSHSTRPSAPTFYSSEHITFSEMVYSGWIQEGDAYLLRLDLPSTFTPTTAHPNVPKFHTKVFYAYVRFPPQTKLFV